MGKEQTNVLKSLNLESLNLVKSKFIQKSFPLDMMTDLVKRWMK